MGFDKPLGEELTSNFNHAMRDLEARQAASPTGFSVSPETPAYAPTGPAISFGNNLGEQLTEIFTRVLRDLEQQHVEPAAAPTAQAYAPMP